MQNPFRDMSRPKALATAGIVAGAVAISGAAAAVNVGLLTGNDSAPFEPQKVSATADGSVTTSTTDPPSRSSYQDVYEQAPAPTTGPAAPSTPSGRRRARDDSDPDSSNGDVRRRRLVTSPRTTRSDDHESEDHESEDHEDEDDGFDD